MSCFTDLNEYDGLRLMEHQEDAQEAEDLRLRSCGVPEYTIEGLKKLKAHWRAMDEKKKA